LSVTEAMSKGLPDSTAGPRVESVAVASIVDRLGGLSVFACAENPGLLSLDELELLHMQPGDAVVQDGEHRSFFAILGGKVKLQVPTSGVTPLVFKKGESFGEIPILANKRLRVVCTAIEPSVLVRFTEDKFWKLMFACPSVREQVLGNMARRLEAYQVHEVRREKLSALGTLAAGLMHELKNPGSAAIRAASQMRENLVRLQQLTLKLSRVEHNPDQMECLTQLQVRALGAQCCRVMSSLEQSDAEQAMEERLGAAGVENGWRVAATLVSMGMTTRELECMDGAFSGEELSDSLNWLESLVSSVQLVGTIEESLGRVRDLIMAVKQYSYDDESSERIVDIHESIQSTLLILGHKMRQKSITIERYFEKDLPRVHLRGGGLSQVWTNLLDNAIDASPEGASLEVKTWHDEASVYVAIKDHGTGIAPQDAPLVFEPFFTTKPVGEGTGLGLDIVHRILSMKLGGAISFESVPGNTVFTVTLPTASMKEALLPA
jgi:signal transduction histidine kinase